MTHTLTHRLTVEEGAASQASLSFMRLITMTRQQLYFKSKQELLSIRNTSMLLLRDAFIPYASDVSERALCMKSYASFSILDGEDHF